MKSIKFNGFNKEQIEEFMNHKLVGFLVNDNIIGQEEYSSLYYFGDDDFGNFSNQPIIIDIGQTIVKNEDGNYQVI